MEFRCLFLCDEAEEPALRCGIEQCSDNAHSFITQEWYHRREDLLYRIRSGCYDAVVVALPGALGMEAVLGVRNLDAKVPLIWCSDDDVFALQSYRLFVTTFLRMPVKAEQLAKALAQCIVET
ncbi:MAG: hypothetical protein RR978_05610 [Oscillospiraceae bacterium]